MDLDLKNKHIIVAGGLGGIGKKTVELLLEEGAKVTIFTQSKINKQINFESKSCLEIVETDYSKQEILETDLEKVNKKIKLEGVIIMVGTGRSNDEIFSNESEVSKLWNINYYFPREIAKAFVNVKKSFVEEEKKQEFFITFCSSIAAKTFLNAPTEYSVAKAALEKLTKELSWKLAPLYRVNCISPGNIFFEGGTWDKIRKSGKLNLQKMLNDKVPAKRFGEPIDIASFAVFLSSSKVSSFFNGSCINIDGGQTTSL